MKLLRTLRLLAAPLLLAFVFWGCRTHEEKKPETITCYAPKPTDKNNVVHKDSACDKDTAKKKVPLHPCYQPPRKKQN